jgi:hypothetical protein
MFGEGLPQERVRAGLERSAFSSQQTENQHRNVFRFRGSPEPPTKGESVKLGNEDLGDDDGGCQHASHFQCALAIVYEVNDESRVVKKVRFELSHVRVALDAEDQRAWSGHNRSARGERRYVRWNGVRDIHCHAGFTEKFLRVAGAA